MANYFNIKLVIDYFPAIVSRIYITLLIVILASIVGLILGTAIAACRIYKVYILNQLATIYISFIRGTPIIVQMFIVYYGLPLILLNLGIDVNGVDKLVFIVITFGLSDAVYFSEIVRSAVTSVDAGQTEAAYSVGMTKTQTFFRILAPQAVTIAIPGVEINIVALLHNTSIAFSLGVIDMMGEVQAIGARTYHTLEGYVDAGLVFIVLSAIIEKLFSIIEKKYSILSNSTERR